MNLLSFFFNDTATTEIYTLSLHDALPICPLQTRIIHIGNDRPESLVLVGKNGRPRVRPTKFCPIRTKLSRSEEHTSELQSQSNLVCRLLLEKKKFSSD